MGFLDFLTKTTKTEPDQQAKVRTQASALGTAVESSAGADLLRCSEAGIESAFRISQVFVTKLGGFSTISTAAEQACQYFSEACHSGGRELFSRVFEQAVADSHFLVPSSSATDYAKEVYERIQEYLFVAEITLSRPGANFDDPFVQKALAHMYCHADGVAQNYRKGMGWYERAAVQNDSAAIFNLGTMLQNGEGVPVNIKKAAEHYLKSAQLGNIGASAMVGHLYLTGEGLPQDFGKAAHWFAISAKSGDASAQANLACLYWNGQGVEADPIQSIGWMYSAAKAGFAGAAQQLSTMKTEVLEAAKDGDANAACILGIMFRDGIGVQQDDAEAFKWFELGARLGSASSQNSLGLRYENGQGVARDLKKAQELFIEADRQGDADAGFNLATMYILGLGVERDERTAIHWLERAASHGNQNAVEALRDNPTKYVCNYVGSHLRVR